MAQINPVRKKQDPLLALAPSLFQVAGGALGGIVGGPPGAAAGSAAGGQLGKLFGEASTPQDPALIAADNRAQSASNVNQLKAGLSAAKNLPQEQQQEFVPVLEQALAKAQSTPQADVGAAERRRRRLEGRTV